MPLCEADEAPVSAVEGALGLMAILRKRQTCYLRRFIVLCLLVATPPSEHLAQYLKQLLFSLAYQFTKLIGIINCGALLHTILVII